MLSTNDELYFTYNDREYQIEHYNENTVYMCVTKNEQGELILERNERFSSIIDLLKNFRIDGKTIYEIWPYAV